jgi:type I restriction enzyme, S subunit
MTKLKYRPFGTLLKKIVDNRGKTCPTAESGMPLIATNCISNEFLYPRHIKVRYVNNDTFCNWFRGHPEAGDIIFVNKGTPGRVAWVPNPVGFCIAQDMVAIKADTEKVYPKYLFAALRSKIMQQEIEGLHVGTLIPHFKKGDFNDLFIPLPSKAMQEYIGNQYFDFSSKIDLLHRQNKTLEAMAETLFRQWFVEEAKEDWEDGTIPDEFDYTMGLSPPGESYNEMGDGIPMFQGNADFGFRFPQKRVFTNDPKRFAEKYDTLISVRAPVGAQNMANEKCCIGRGVSAFHYKKKDGFYTYTYFKLGSLMKEIKSFNDTGTVFGSINKSDFESFEIVIPPQELVEKFQGEIAPIDNKIISNTIQIQTLEKLRDTLLPKLMSGEVRVKYEN